MNQPEKIGRPDNLSKTIRQTKSQASFAPDFYLNSRISHPAKCARGNGDALPDILVEKKSLIRSPSTFNERRMATFCQVNKTKNSISYLEENEQTLIATIKELEKPHSKAGGPGNGRALRQYCR